MSGCTGQGCRGERADGDGRLLGRAQGRSDSTSSTSPSQPGDYILNHVGYAIRRIPAEEIGATLALYEELLDAPAEEDDLMAADVRGEIAGARQCR